MLNRKVHTMRKVIDSFILAETKAGNYRGYGKKFIKANKSKTPSNIGFTKAKLVKKEGKANA